MQHSIHLIGRVLVVSQTLKYLNFGRKANVVLMRDTVRRRIVRMESRQIGNAKIWWTTKLLWLSAHILSVKGRKQSTTNRTIKPSAYTWVKQYIPSPRVMNSEITTGTQLKCGSISPSLHLKYCDKHFTTFKCVGSTFKAKYSFETAQTNSDNCYDMLSKAFVRSIQIGANFEWPAIFPLALFLA